jgi:hypothetical protein
MRLKEEKNARSTEKIFPQFTLHADLLTSSGFERGATMNFSVAGQVAIQALTMLGSSGLSIKAQTCADDVSFVCGYYIVDEDWDMVVDNRTRC